MYVNKCVVKVPGTGYTLTSNRGVYKIEEDISKCSCTFSRGFGLPCRHILFVAAQEAITLPIEMYNQRWKTIEEETEEHLPDAYTPIASRQKGRENLKLVDRSQLFSEANLLARSIANTMQDLPLPTFDGYMCLLRQLHRAIQENRKIRLIEGMVYLFAVMLPSLSNFIHLDVADTQVATIVSTPARSPLSLILSESDTLILSDSLIGVLNDMSPFMENFGSFDPATQPRRPTSLTLISPSMEGASMTLAYHCSEGGSTMTVTVRSPTAGSTQAGTMPSVTITELPTVHTATQLAISDVPHLPIAGTSTALLSDAPEISVPPLLSTEATSVVLHVPPALTDPQVPPLFHTATPVVLDVPPALTDPQLPPLLHTATPVVLHVPPALTTKTNGPRTRRPRGHNVVPPTATIQKTTATIQKTVAASSSTQPNSTQANKRARETEDSNLPQLQDLELPQMKKRRGRPRKIRKLLQYALSKKPFTKKKKKEQAISNYFQIL